MNVVRGSVVKALAGRDKGCYFVAVAADDRCVYIADGKSRKISAPKRKNVKHISPTDSRVDITGMTDKQLRRYLAAFLTRNPEADPDHD